MNGDFRSDMQKNEGFSKRILKVLPERAKRPYFGGREIDRFTGTSYGDGEYPDSEELTKTFGMEELTITGSYRLNRYGRFAICFVLDGTGSVETSAQTEVLKKGDILFIPAEVNESIWKPTGHPLKIILCYPSLTKRQADVC